MKAIQITSTPKEFTKVLEMAQRIINSWPKWKRDIPVTLCRQPQFEVEGEEDGR